MMGVLHLKVLVDTYGPDSREGDEHQKEPSKMRSTIETCLWEAISGDKDPQVDLVPE